MHSTTTFEPAGVAEIRTLYAQWQRGLLSNDEYATMFRMVDAAHSHNVLCANGDHRQAQVMIASRPLCGVCALKEREARA